MPRRQSPGPACIGYKPCERPSHKVFCNPWDSQLRLLAITRSVVFLSLLGRVGALQLLVVPVPLLSRHGRARATYVTIPTSSGTSRPAAWHRSEEHTSELQSRQ